MEKQKRQKKQIVPNILLKKARIQKPWTLEELAAKISALPEFGPGEPDPYTISRWESGVSSPRPRYRRALCTIFEMDAQELGLLPRSVQKTDEQHPLPQDQEPSTIVTADAGEETLPVPLGSSLTDIPEHFKVLDICSSSSSPSPNVSATWQRPSASIRFLSAPIQLFCSLRYWQRIILVVSLPFILITGGFLYNLLKSSHPSTAVQTAAAETEDVSATTSSLQALYRSITSRPPTEYTALNKPNELNWDINSYCAFQNGKYIIHSPAYSYMVCKDGTSYACNMAYQVKMTILRGSGGGVVFRSSSVNEYRFRVNANGSYDLVNAITLLEKNANAAIKQKLHVENTVGLIARNSQIDLFVNGQLITRVTDGAAKCGLIGLMAVGDANDTTVAYSDAKIWRVKP